MNPNPDRSASLRSEGRPFGPSVLATALLLAAASAQAQPPATEGSIADSLSAADMTFSLEELEGKVQYDVTTKDGYTFKLEETEAGYTFSLEEATAAMPRSGNWYVEFLPGRVVCPESPSMAPMIPLLLDNGRRAIAMVMGSPDRGETMPFEFSRPFDVGQVFDPMAEVFSRADADVELHYPAVVDGYLYPFHGVIENDDDPTRFKGEVAVISETYMMGTLSGSNDTCSIDGVLMLTRREG